MKVGREHEELVQSVVLDLAEKALECITDDTKLFIIKAVEKMNATIKDPKSLQELTAFCGEAVSRERVMEFFSLKFDG